MEKPNQSQQIPSRWPPRSPYTLFFSDGVSSRSVGSAVVRTARQDTDAGETMLGEGRRLGFGVAHFWLENAWFSKVDLELEA